MLEQALEALREEVHRLRETIERQNALLRGRTVAENSAPPTAEWLNEAGVGRFVGISAGTLRK